MQIFFIVLNKKCVLNKYKYNFFKSLVCYILLYKHIQNSEEINQLLTVNETGMCCYLL